MVSDSSISDGDRIWIGRKVYRWRGHLIGFSGDVAEAEEFLPWFKSGMVDKPPRFGSSQALILSAAGLYACSGGTTLEQIKSGREAIGTGGKAAMCVYEALKWENPQRAVAIVCKHDAASRPPVRTYRL